MTVKALAHRADVRIKQHVFPRVGKGSHLPLAWQTRDAGAAVAIREDRAG